MADRRGEVKLKTNDKNEQRNARAESLLTYWGGKQRGRETRHLSEGKCEGTLLSVRIERGILGSWGCKKANDVRAEHIQCAGDRVVIHLLNPVVPFATIAIAMKYIEVSGGCMVSFCRVGCKCDRPIEQTTNKLENNKQEVQTNTNKLTQTKVWGGDSK